MAEMQQRDDAHGSLERIVDRNIQLRAFALRLLTPEDLGYAATPEIRDAARQALGMPRVETKK
jgi:predicted nucleotide-binding protein